MGTRNGVLAKLLLLGFGSGIALIGIELGLRVVGYEGFHASSRVNHEILQLTGNPELPYVLMPGARGSGWETEIVVNSHGFRDREFSEDKGDVFRLVAIGDSITFGSHIASPSLLYPKQLEALLRERDPSLQAEVLNFGVTGYDVVNNVENLRVNALKFQPDVVLVGFCINDIGTASTAMEYVVASRYLGNPIFRLRTAQLLLTTGLRLVAKNQAKREAQTGAFAAHHAGLILPIGEDAELTTRIAELAHFNDGDVEWGMRQWTEPSHIGFLEYAFTKLRALGQQYDFDVVVVGVPFLDSEHIGGWRIVHEILRHESQKFGFYFVDLLDRFEEAGLEHLRNEPTDLIHPSPEGHAMIADELYDYLEGSTVLTGPRSGRAHL